MSCLRCLIVLGLFLISQAQAHVVPNMTIEAEFAADHSYTLRLNVDPRVFLSDQPTSLPPVSADWYLSQSEDQKKETYAKATEYLKANVGLTFNDQTIALPACEFIAMDGATNEEVKPDTAETHLLATAHSEVPAGADQFKIVFGRGANVSLILLNSEAGMEEKRPQVIFPGESSRPFKLTQATVKEPQADKEPEIVKISEVTVKRVYPEASKVFAIIGGSLLLLMILGAFFIKRNKRR